MILNNIHRGFFFRRHGGVERFVELDPGFLQAPQAAGFVAGDPVLSPAAGGEGNVGYPADFAVASACNGPRRFGFSPPLRWRER